MADGLVNSVNNSVFSYKDFLLTHNVESKRTDEYGLLIAKDIESQVSAGNSINGYYYLRNNRLKTNIMWASGKINIYSMFADWLALNGKFNYANIKWSAPLIVNRIISGLVGRWMERQEKIQVKAIDPISVKAKQQQYEQAEFVLYNRAQLEQLQQASGVPMVPPDQFVAEDKDELEEWAVSGTRIPEEIKYETGTNDILDSNGFFDVMKEKLLHDSCECGLVCTYVWMDEEGVIHVEWVKPINSFYSYSEYNDFRDTAYRGFIKSMKISELRRKYGKEFGGKLTEEQIFQIAQSSTQWQRYDKLNWNTDWILTYIRPYDEWNIEVMVFWVKSVDEDSYLMTVTKQNKSTILERRQQPPANLDSNQEFIKKDKWNLYKGVYARTSGVILEWGLDNNMIRPQDPKESGDVEFPISMYMYQNQDMRNVALPEKIEEPVQQMILARLKIQQLVAKMKPTGSMINYDAIQEIDLGLAADGQSRIDVQKVYEQTGDLYYRGRDAEGNPIPVPIQELQNSGFVAQLDGLVKLYEYHYKVLRDELGEDPNLVSAAAQPRVTSENVQFSQQQAAYSTDYMYNAYVNVMEQTARKIACLLNNSVRFGASAYRHIMQEEDVKDRNFSTEIKLLPDQYALSKFEGFLNQSIATNPEFIQFADPFQLMRIAKEDVKLAELMMRNAMKKMWKAQEQRSARQQEDNAKLQSAVAQQTAQAEFKLAQGKAHLAIVTEDAKSKADNEKTVLQGIFELLKAGIPIPPELNTVKTLVLNNVALSLTQENKQMISDMTMEEMAKQQAMRQQQQGAQPDEGQEQSEQMQPEQQPEMQMQ